MKEKSINLADVLFELATEQLGATNQNEVAKLLNVQATQLSSYRSNNNAGSSVIKKMIKSFAEAYLKESGYTNVNAVEVLSEYVAEKNNVDNQSQIANYLGLNQSALSSYKKSNSAGANALKNILNHLLSNMQKVTLNSVINPILEFKRINPEKYNSKYLLLPNEHSKDQLKDSLEKKVGVYLFYNSQGQNFYIGKTERDLYFEITQQLGRKIEFYSEGIKKNKIHQGDIAHYLTVYEIKPKELIKDVEALLIRSYANDNTNIKMENFSKWINESG